MPLTLTDFNTATADDVRPALTACLAVPRWVD
ncbi:MAG TPA: OHCU decarboxylase, partial [Amycolatopsis sp.]